MPLHTAKTAAWSDCRHWVAGVKPCRGGRAARRGARANNPDATCLIAALDELYRDLLARCLVQRKLHEAERAAIEISNLRHAWTARGTIP